MGLRGHDGNLLGAALVRDDFLGVYRGHPAGTDEETESWMNTLLSGDGFSAWIGTTVVLALWSLLTMVIVGSSALFLITRGAASRHWPPFGQASAAAGIALLPAAAAALLPLVG